MPSARRELRPTIDREWLEAELKTDPLAHAYALWDLVHLPSSIRFVSAVEEGRTVAYLLLWLGRPNAPVVHWVGAAEGAAALLHQFPPAPFEAIVPAGAEPLVHERYPGARRSTILLLWRPPGPVPWADPERTVRRLRRSDGEELRSWSREKGTEDRPDFGEVDLGVEPVWGAFAGGRLVGVSRAAVRLPAVWVVSGVYVDHELRGRGLGRRLVAALIEEAERAGAPTGLFVREEAHDARRIYASLGYREVGRRVWVDVPRPRPRAASAGRAEGGSGR